MIANESTLPSKTREWIEDWVSKNDWVSERLSIEPLAGDGSSRTFYRMTIDNESQILLFDPDWILSKSYAPHQQYLKNHRVSVPEIFAVEENQGCLIMQDLGDVHLQKVILDLEKQKMEWLKKAIKMLAHLHGSTFPVPHDAPAAKLIFDKKKYLGEWLYTFDNLCHRLLLVPNIEDDKIREIENYCENLGGIFPLSLYAS